MRFRAKSIKDSSAIDVSFTASRVTQQGIHRGDLLFEWNNFTFEKLSPFTALTGADIEALECKVRRCTATDDELELWGLVK